LKGLAREAVVVSAGSCIGMIPLFETNECEIHSYQSVGKEEDEEEKCIPLC
jgi:hypothetical protein